MNIYFNLHIKMYTQCFNRQQIDGLRSGYFCTGHVYCVYQIFQSYAGWLGRVKLLYLDNRHPFTRSNIRNDLTLNLSMNQYKYCHVFFKQFQHLFLMQFLSKQLKSGKGCKGAYKESLCPNKRNYAYISYKKHWYLRSKAFLGRKKE